MLLFVRGFSLGNYWRRRRRLIWWSIRWLDLLLGRSILWLFGRGFVGLCCLGLVGSMLMLVFSICIVWFLRLLWCSSTVGIHITTIMFKPMGGITRRGWQEHIRHLEFTSKYQNIIFVQFKNTICYTFSKYISFIYW